MTIRDISRREFVVGTTVSLVAAGRLGAQPATLTAQQIVDRIRANVGVPWRETTVDGFKAGLPSTVVTSA